MALTDHQQKYNQGMQNPIVARLIRRFFYNINTCIEQFCPHSILDVGCGDGSHLLFLSKVLPETYLGIDIEQESIERCKTYHPHLQFQTGNIYKLPLPDHSYDIVLCMEVLEHLDTPQNALQELLRTARKGIIISVPWEPWFQLGNLARGKYLRSFGNHPEHLQHWNPKSFALLIKLTSSKAKFQFFPSWPWFICTLAQ